MKIKEFKKLPKKTNLAGPAPVCAGAAGNGLEKPPC